MNTNIKAVLLDVDGTIFSSEEIILDTYGEEFRRSHEETGKPKEVPDHALIMAQIGKPVKEIFHNLVPELTQEEQDQLSENILHNLVARIGRGEGEHYAGVTETCQKMAEKGIKLYTASNGRFPYVEAILKSNKTTEYFDGFPVLDYVKIHNKVELVKHILDEYGLAPEEALMVGDRTSDRDSAVENNVPFVACKFGHGTAEEHEGASIYIDSFPELLEHI